MAHFVLDASLTMAWCYPDEQSAFADKVLESLAAGLSAVVPSMWAVEVANSVIMGERRNRVSQLGAARFFGLIEGLPIEIDGQTAYQAFGATLKLARAQKLSAYDATYLELAMRENLVLATLDEKLQSAAKRVGVTLFA